MLQRSASPVYVPREWMLAEAYTQAEEGDFSLVRQLQELFDAPYEEHPELHERYFRKTPKEMRHKGGISYYS